MPCTKCVCLMHPKRRWSSPTSRWKPSATTPIGPPLTWPASGANTPATKARCGNKASCPWTHLICSSVSVEVMLKSIAPCAWTGMLCAIKLPRTACATPTVWRLRLQRPSPTSSALTLVLSLALATSPSSPICLVNSPSSTATWCAT